jgi:DNA-binding NtrC family response regulator
MTKSVVVVDDHHAVAEMLGQMLRVLGHQVEVFSSPSSCLEWLETSKPDMGFFDLRMPGIDGVTLLEKVRARGHQFPVIAITGYASDEMVREIKEIGALAVASKPLSMDVLQGLVQLT